MSAVERAAQHVASALLGRTPISHASPYSLLAARIYYAPLYRTVYTLLMLSLCALAWWEPPNALSSRSPALVTLLRALDGLCLLAALCDAALQRALLGPAWPSRPWMRAKALVICCLAANWASVVALGGATPYYLRALRPLLVVERLRNARKVLSNILAALPAMLNVGVVALVFHFFFSILAVVLFNGIDGASCTRERGVKVPPLGCSAFAPAGADDANFACKLLLTSLGEASIHLFALAAGGSNFPMVMMPFYACQKASALFFAAYLVLVTVLLASGAIAVASAVSADQQREEAVKRYARSLGGCDLAFTLLTGGNVEEAAAAAAKLSDFSPSPSLSLLFSVKKRSSSSSSSGGAGGGASPTGAGGGGGPSFAPAAFEPRVQQASILSLFELLRPDLPAATVALLCDAARAHKPAALAKCLPLGGDAEAAQGEVEEEGEDGSLSPLSLVIEAARRKAFGTLEQQRAAAMAAAAGLCEERGLTRAQFRVLIMVLAQLRVRRKAQGAGEAAQAAQQGVGAGCARDVGACARRWVGRGSIGASRPAPASRGAAEEEDADWLDGDGEGQEGVAVSNPLGPLAPTLSPGALTGGQGSIQVWGESKGSGDAAAQGAGTASGGPPAAAPPLSPSCCSSAVSVFLLPPSMPELPPDSSPLRQRAGAIIGSSGASLVFDSAILINTIVELYRMAVEVEGAPLTPTVLALIYFQRALLGVFVLEFSLKITVWGPLRFLSAGLGHKLDALIITASLGAAFGEIAGALPASVALFIFTLRSLRLVRYGQKLRLKVAERSGLEVLPGLDTSLSALLDCLPSLARFFLVFASILYAFVVVGVEAFHGVLRTSNPLVAASAYGTALSLTNLTFDNFSRALVTVFALMLRTVAWPVIMEGAVAGTGTLGARAYFVVLQLALPALCLPLLVGLCVETFQVMRLHRQALADELNKRGKCSSAGVLDWRELIQGSGVKFSGMLPARDRARGDVFDALHRAEIVRAFPEFRRGE